VADVHAMQADSDVFAWDGEPEIPGRPPTRLIVFSDDWGRHPSSSQHLVRQLLPTHGVLWVNTVGTRTPGLSVADISRAAGKLRSWAGGDKRSTGAALREHLAVISPKMWPGFRRPWQRRLNARSITKAVHASLGPRALNEHRIAITTLPITADLVNQLDVDRWVYYCVDDFSVWPGLDSEVMQTMERELVEKVDDVVAVSQTLQERIAGMGTIAGLLTHGIDADHWSATRDRSPKPVWWPKTAEPVAMFWGLIDQRLDITWCRALSKQLEKCGGGLVFVGPQQSPAPEVHRLPQTVLPGPVAYHDLPSLAVKSDVLVMPYVDAPVTRAMQPLKFKEYLATMKPVVVRNLPATRDWTDCCDVVTNESEFVRVCMERAKTGLPESQRRARQRRLPGESWSHKARRFASIWTDDEEPLMRNAA